MNKSQDNFYDTISGDEFANAFKEYKKYVDEHAKHKQPTKKFQQSFALGMKTQEFINIYDDPNASATMEYDDMDAQVTLVLPLFDFDSKMMVIWREMMLLSDELSMLYSPLRGGNCITMVVRNVFTY